MSSIKQAMKRVMDGKNEGVVVASGQTFNTCGCEKVGSCSRCDGKRYLIIKLKDGGMITQYENYPEVQINKGMIDGMPVYLELMGNHYSGWKPYYEKQNPEYEGDRIIGGRCDYNVSEEIRSMKVPIKVIPYVGNDSLVPFVLDVLPSSLEDMKNFILSNSDVLALIGKRKYDFKFISWMEVKIKIT